MTRSLFTLLVLLFAGLSALAQNQTGCEPEMRLVDVDIDRKDAYVKLRVLAKGPDCEPMQSLSNRDFKIVEQVQGRQERTLDVTRIGRILPAAIYDTTDLNQESVSVLFLVDVSAGGNPRASAEMIGTFLDGNQYFQTYTKANFRLRTFSDELTAPQTIDPQDPAAVLNQLKQQVPNGRAGLYPAVITALRELDYATDKQLVFLFSPGTDEPKEYGTAPKLPPRSEDVYTAAQAAGGNLYLFTISPSGNQDSLGAAAGAKGGFMSRLPTKTPRSEDSYAAGTLPRGVAEIFVTDRRLISSHIIEVATLVPEIRGRERTYTLNNLATPGVEPSSFSDRFGSENTRFILGRREEGTKWLIPSLVGIVGVGFLLAVFAFVMPLIRSKRFEQQFVVPYVPRPGRQILDPMTREPIASGEPVVNICAMVVPLQTWNDCGGQCPHYSGCTNNNLQCKGEGRGESTKFFSLHGVNRRLNWVWFGACGGLLGWLIYALVGGLGEDGISKVANTLAHLGDDADTLIRDSLLGACFGLGLTFMLAWMEERAQSRKKSWPRIIGRALLGGLWATAAFGGGYLLLESSIISSPILAAAFSWVLFGLGLGFILSLKSSIDHQRGLLGGLLAGVIGFLIYWISSGMIDTSLIPKVLSLLVAGGLLGLVLDTVVKLAESYEMEYVSPENYRRNVPLSKWLKSDWEILIGSQPGSQVYVKWPDEDVLPEHAIMKMEDGRVFLLPQGETLVNGKIINGSKRTQLASGDTIQLGRRGITTMRFWER